MKEARFQFVHESGLYTGYETAHFPAAVAGFPALVLHVITDEVVDSVEVAKYLMLEAAEGLESKAQPKHTHIPVPSQNG
jgi:hypothetical protein